MNAEEARQNSARIKQEKVKLEAEKGMAAYMQTVYARIAEREEKYVHVDLQVLAYTYFGLIRVSIADRCIAILKAKGFEVHKHDHGGYIISWK